VASRGRDEPDTERSGRSYARHVWSQRSVVDYGLARRATLNALLGQAPGGPTLPQDACDAHPYLLRAARFHGEPTGRDCPVCRRERLVDVSYVYGEQLGRLEGRVAGRAELAAMAREHGEFRVYVVEVCAGCAWNHLVQSYVLGDGVDRRIHRGQHPDAAEHAGAGAGSGSGAEG
jgi:hypothetical protein